MAAASYEDQSTKIFVDTLGKTSDTRVTTGKPMSSTPRPTDTELAILRVLWALGPSTVRQVHSAWESQRGPVAYTTVLKLLQVMHDKQLVVRDTSTRSHVYTPVHSEDAVQGSLVTDLVSKAFGGSAADLVMRALSVRPSSPDELHRIRELIDQLDAEGAEGEE
ncbi:MAG: BlaI/MecI/CopY family transcriptional regulator [Myxococcota bacterium]